MGGPVRIVGHDRAGIEDEEVHDDAGTNARGL